MFHKTAKQTHDTRSNQAFLVQRQLLDEKEKKTKQGTFRNTKAEGNEEKKNTIEIEGKKGKRRDNKKREKKNTVLRKRHHSTKQSVGRSQVFEKRAVIRFGNLQKSEETKSQSSYMSCPELNGIW